MACILTDVKAWSFFVSKMLVQANKTFSRALLVLIIASELSEQPSPYRMHRPSLHCKADLQFAKLLRCEQSYGLHTELAGQAGKRGA